jgi:L-alanine-DL-glutamate epimerase-like enolase superfamily enzyme
MKAQILEATVEFFDRPFARPLPLRTGFITEITEARATVRVRVGGRESVGRGAIYLSDLWAWPDGDLTHQQRDADMRTLCHEIAQGLPELCGGEPEHPLELGLRLHDQVCTTNLPSAAPALARLVCASPFDAALHDAVGLALGCSAFDLCTDSYPIPSADALFPNLGACEAIRRTLHPPTQTLDAWMVVGPQTPLEEIGQWVRDRGYRCFKLRIPVEPGPDVVRTVEVFEAVHSFGVVQPRLSVDSNEMHAGSDQVRDYLERLHSYSADCFNALYYLEQPTHRDIRTHAFDWRTVTRLKPVLIDEGLTSTALFKEAAAQGWSGFALKTCKGHSFSLVAAAWARENGLFVTMQDLTNPGLAAIHAALFASRIPTLNGIELNSPQFTPAANAEWLPRLGSLLDPTDGVHHVPPGDTLGLGSTS